MNKLGKIIVVVTIVGVVGFAATSFAGWGRGWGGGGNCRGQYGYPDNLSDQDLEKIQQERRAFFEDTRELRQKLNQKKLELRGEMAKQEPDVNKAVALQKEVSELQGQLDQKRVEQRIKMKKENPDFFAGRGYGMGRGYGKGQGYGGMGRGFGGRGYQGCDSGGCWE